MPTHRTAIPWLIVGLFGGVGLFLTLPLPGMLQLPLLALQAVCLSLLAISVAAGVAHSHRPHMPPGPLGDGHDGPGRPDFRWSVKASLIIGLVVAAAAWPWAWPRFSLAWTEAWFGSAGRGITGSGVDPASALMLVVGAFLPLQAYCVVLYFALWVCLQAACQAEVHLARQYVAAGRKESPGAESPRPPSQKVTAAVAGVLLVLLGCVMVMGSSPWYTSAVARRLDLQREETESGLANLQWDIQALSGTQSPTISPPVGGAKELYEWIQQDLGPEWRGLRDAAPVCPFLDKEAGTLRDPWGNEVIYRRPAVRHPDWPYDLYSVGPNGVDEQGGGDDVTIDGRLARRFSQSRR